MPDIRCNPPMTSVSPPVLLSRCFHPFLLHTSHFTHLSLSLVLVSPEVSLLNQQRFFFSPKAQLSSYINTLGFETPEDLKNLMLNLKAASFPRGNRKLIGLYVYDELSAYCLSISVKKAP